MNSQPLKPGQQIEHPKLQLTGEVKEVAGVRVTWEDENRCIRESYRNHLTYIPSEDEIAAAAAEVRKSWSRAEHERRSVYRPQAIRFVDALPYMEYVP